MTETIKFTFRIDSSDGNHSIFNTTREAKPTDSIRALAISVIKESFGNGVDSWTYDIDEKSAIQIHLDNKEPVDPLDSTSDTFGIGYSINKDQSIRVLSYLEPLHTDWTIAELKELLKYNYIRGDLSHILISIPSGLGTTGWPSAFDWVGFLINLYTPAKLGWRHALYAIDIVSRQKIRKIAKTWEKNGISYPQILREFLDTKAEWSMPEVKRRLKLSDEHAIKLLQSLGYEPIGNNWRITHSELSIKNRSRWLSLEEEYTENHQYIETVDTESNDNARLVIVISLLATITAFITLVDAPLFEPVKLILAISGFLQFMFLVFSAEMLRFNLSHSVVNFLNSPFAINRLRKRFYNWSVQIYLLAFVGLGALIAIDYISPEEIGAKNYISNLVFSVFSLDQSSLALSSLVSALLLLGASYVIAILLRFIISAWKSVRRHE